MNRALDTRRTRPRRGESSTVELAPRIERAMVVDAPGDPQRAAEHLERLPDDAHLAEAAVSLIAIRA